MMNCKHRELISKSFQSKKAHKGKRPYRICKQKEDPLIIGVNIITYMHI